MSNDNVILFPGTEQEDIGHAPGDPVVNVRVVIQTSAPARASIGGQIVACIVVFCLTFLIGSAVIGGL